MQLLRSGQIPEAQSALMAAIEADSEHFESYLALGSALMLSSRFTEASAVLSKAVALRPDSAAASRDLGAAYDNQNLHEQAIEAFKRAVELAPRLGEIHLRLAQLYTLHSRMEEAAQCFDSAAALKPRTTAAALYRADAALLRGDMAAAEAWARKAVAQDPGSDAARGTLGGLLYAQGRFNEAIAAFESAVRNNPKSAKCWDGLARCQKYGSAGASVLDRMSAVLQRSDIPDGDRTIIHFAIGKVYDDGGDCGHAMEHFEAGNRLRSRTMAFDRAALAGMVDRTIQQFTPAFLARSAADGAPDATPLFIVGMYRSGTTLVEQILSSHPDIAAGGELTVWTPADIDIDATTADFDRDRTGIAVAKYLATLRRISAGSARIIDKLPTNFFRLGAIHALMPNARFIHCERDPIDTCLSIYTTLFGSPLPYAARKDDLVFFYRQYRRIMAHWHKVLPLGIMLDVQYESLVANREAETRRMVAFTGLDWDSRCLQPHENPRSVTTASAWQARQPVYATSVQRWRRYEPWIGALQALAPDNHKC